MSKLLQNLKKKELIGAIVPVGGEYFGLFVLVPPSNRYGRSLRLAEARLDNDLISAISKVARQSEKVEAWKLASEKRSEAGKPITAGPSDIDPNILTAAEQAKIDSRVDAIRSCDPFPCECGWVVGGEDLARAYELYQSISLLGGGSGALIARIMQTAGINAVDSDHVDDDADDDDRDSGKSAAEQRSKLLALLTRSDRYSRDDLIEAVKTSAEFADELARSVSVGTNVQSVDWSAYKPAGKESTGTGGQ
jgi:hypothetical protein